MARQPIKKIWNAGRNLRRVISGGRAFHYRDGKRINKKQFERSYKARIVGKRPKWKKLVSGKPLTDKRLKQPDLFVKEVAPKVREVTLKVKDYFTYSDKIASSYSQKDKSEAIKFSLCRVKDRKALYEQIKSDRKMLHAFVSDEEHNRLRVDVNIGYDLPQLTKKDRESNRGYRRFKDLWKLYHFLGLSYSYGEKEGETLPDFGKRNGICKYKKVAYLVAPVMQGLRQIGLRIYRKYIYNP